MSENDKDGALRGRRLSLTISMSIEEPIERAFLDSYDEQPVNGYKRQEFLRRNLLLGFAVQGVAAGTVTLKEIAQKCNLQIEGLDK